MYMSWPTLTAPSGCYHSFCVDWKWQNNTECREWNNPLPNRNQKTWAQCNDEQGIQSDHQANGIPSPCFWPLKFTSLSALPTLASRSYRSSSTLSMRACSFLQISWRQRWTWCLLTTLYFIQLLIMTSAIRQHYIFSRASSVALVNALLVYHFRWIAMKFCRHSWLPEDESY